MSRGNPYYNSEGYADPTAYLAMRTVCKQNEQGGNGMTLKELSQLYYLNREIEKKKKELAELRETISSPSRPNLTGLPSGNADNRIERYISEIVHRESIISEMVIQCLRERNKLERYIADISDSLTRQIFTLRFINGLSWRQVAYSVGGNNTEASVKMICYRYIKAHK